MSERIKRAWWDTFPPFAIIGAFEALFVRKTVARQIAVAADWDQAPVGSTQEEFPTLFPLEAHRILHANDNQNKKG